VVTACAAPPNARLGKPAAQPATATAPASGSTDTVVASTNGLAAKLEYPAGLLTAHRIYPAVVTLSNEGTRAVTVTTHAGTIFDLTAADAAGHTVYDWYVATGRSKIKGGPGQLRLEPGQSVNEHREFALPGPGLFTLAVDFVVESNRQNVGHLLSARVEVR
jgi:hypothetical protein